MAINSINKDFSNRKKDVNFLAKDFSSYRQRLIDFSKTYFPNTYNDFTEGSVGNMFIELTSYVGDVLSYNIDYNFKEALLTNASEEKNIIRLAQSLGYKVPLSSAAVTTLKVYQLLPIDAGGQPDWTYALKVNSGMIVGSSQDSSVTFRTLENIDFSDMENLENVNDYLEIYQEDGSGNPETWLVEYFREIPVSSGTVKQTTVNVGAPEQFLTIELPDDDVIDIISVVDSDGNRYYEVDYLAQDSIISQVQINSSAEPFYQPKILKVSRRFVTKVNKDLKKEIQFGSGTTIDLDEETISSIFQADNVTGDTELSIDPSSFSTSKTYGKAPANTTLTIKYSTGGGSLSNIGQGDLTDLREVVYTNDESAFGGIISTLNQIKTTLTVTNTEQATGGRGRLSPAEIRENALAFFNSQKRCVTAGDYKVRILSMPSRFGNVSKAFVRRNQQFSQNETEKPTINAYILSYDNNGRLNTLNEQTKKNISIYLNEFRMLTDGVNLLDGYVVNIGVEFEISVFSSFNKNEVLLKAIEVVKDFFDTDKMDFNQPIYISDLELQIGAVEGVRTVNNVKVVNKTADNGNYSQIYYPIESATRDKIVYPSVEPSVFEVKFPNTDIKGKVK